jgi:hypothetical protein
LLWCSSGTSGPTALSSESSACRDPWSHGSRPVTPLPREVKARARPMPWRRERDEPGVQPGHKRFGTHDAASVERRSSHADLWEGGDGAGGSRRRRAGSARATTRPTRRRSVLPRRATARPVRMRSRARSGGRIQRATVRRTRNPVCREFNLPVVRVLPDYFETHQYVSSAQPKARTTAWPAVIPIGSVVTGRRGDKVAPAHRNGSPSIRLPEPAKAGRARRASAAIDS